MTNTFSGSGFGLVQTKHKRIYKRYFCKLNLCEVSTKANRIHTSNALGFVLTLTLQCFFFSVKKLALSCSFIILHFKCIFFFFIWFADGIAQPAAQVFDNSLSFSTSTHFSDMHLPNTVNNKTQFRKVPALYTLCPQPCPFCYTLCTTSLAAIKLLWYEADIFSGPLCVLLFWINR